jgi:hypothetical protein
MTPGRRRCAAVLVVGHLDSVNHDDGPEGSAPGADDNGSGAAGVIAMAEALQTVREQVPIAFVLFGGEEQGLHGGRHLVANLSDERRAAPRPHGRGGQRGPGGKLPGERSAGVHAGVRLRSAGARVIPAAPVVVLWPLRRRATTESSRIPLCS